MKNRKVKYVLYGHEVDMGGFPVRQAFPTQRVQQLDPFLLIHHAHIQVPDDFSPKHAGVGPHPHRGFSPVTFVFKGAVHHRDSRGNDSVVYAGGAQWMNAGRGIMHSERPAENIHQHGGEQEIIQLWINTPAKNKMDQPAYYPVQANESGRYTSPDGKATVNVFSGELMGVKGPVPSTTPVNAATMTLSKGARLSIAVPPSHNVFLYILSGSLNIEGHGLTDPLHAIAFDTEGDTISFTSVDESRVLFLTGEPLNEPVVSHGPFVMNNQTQILEAMRDYQMGKMGILIED